MPEEIEEIMDDEEDVMIIRRNKLFSNIVEVLETIPKHYFYVGSSSTMDNCRIGMWFAGGGSDISKSMLVDKDVPIYDTFVESLQKYLKTETNRKYTFTHFIQESDGSCEIYDKKRAIFVKVL